MKKCGLKVAAFIVATLFVLSAFANEPAKRECKQHYRPLKSEGSCQQNEAIVNSLEREHQQGKKLCIETVERLTSLEQQYQAIELKGKFDAQKLGNEIGKMNGASDSELIDQAKSASSVAERNAAESLQLIARLESQYKEIQDALAKQMDDYRKLEINSLNYESTDSKSCKADREAYASYISKLSGELNTRHKEAEHYMAEMQKHKMSHIQGFKASHSSLEKLNRTEKSMESVNANADDSAWGRVSSSVGDFFSGDSKNAPESEQPNHSKSVPSGDNSADATGGFTSVVKDVLGSDSPSTAKPNHDQLISKMEQLNGKPLSEKEKEMIRQHPELAEQALQANGMGFEITGQIDDSGREIVRLPDGSTRPMTEEEQARAHSNAGFQKVDWFERNCPNPQSSQYNERSCQDWRRDHQNPSAGSGQTTQQPVDPQAKYDQCVKDRLAAWISLHPNQDSTAAEIAAGKYCANLNTQKLGI